MEESEAQARREEVLSQLLSMLNKAARENEQEEKSGYLQGSLGLVPA